jgi:cephalosporin hydroxylase
MTRTLVGQQGIVSHFYEDVPGFFHFAECYKRLLRSLPDDRPSRWVEIGSFQGRSTCWLGVEILRAGKPVELNCVDSWKFPDPIEGAAIREAFTRHTWPIRAAMGDQFRVWPIDSLGAAECFGDESVDVVFVDGDHNYEAVLADISTWWPKLKVGGFMAGDDFMMSDVCRAVCEQFAPSGYILCHGWTTVPESQCWPSWMAKKA